MIWIFSFLFMWAQCGDAALSLWFPQVLQQFFENYWQSEAVEEGDIVKIQDFYESLCSPCRHFMVNHFVKTVNKLGDRLEVHGYPYGNAKTIEHENGTYDFVCQHGPKECYGNMLHACAIDILPTHTAAINFNACLMDLNEPSSGSNDKMAEKCGKEMNVNYEAIKACAGSQRGKELHKMYGEESEKQHFKGVPHILINGVQFLEDDFFKAVCDAFKNPPKECST